MGNSNVHLFTIGEKEFAMICEELRSDADSVFKHNPRSTREESLLWMLLGILISYLNLSENETPCFNGPVNAKTYREAISFVLSRRAREKFDFDRYLKMFEE